MAIGSDAARPPKFLEGVLDWWRNGIGAYSALPENLWDLAASSFVLNMLALALPLGLLHVYDRIIPNLSSDTLALLVLGLAIALFLESALQLGRTYITGWIGARFEHTAGCAALERLCYSKIEDFERVGSGVHLERLNALGQVKEFYAGQAMVAILDLPFIVVFLGAVAFLGHSLVFVPIAIIAAFLGGAYLVGNRLRGALQERHVSDDRRYNFLIEVLSGIHTVKSMAMEALMLRRYERLQENCADHEYQVAYQSAAASGLASFFSQATTVAVVAFGALKVMNGNMTVGGLAACTLLAGRALGPLQKALGIWSRFQTVRLAQDRLREIFALPTEEVPGLPQLPAIKGQIELVDVSFRHRADLPDVLRGVSLSIAEGECVGISGGNGSGKTTLLALMMGVLQPSEGIVRLDGYDLREYDPHALRGRLAYLPQQGVLFQGTILQNLTMFRPELTEEALHTAGVLGLDDVVANLPLGYESRVGDGAFDSLPRGIRQRIAIARALLRGPHVVLFDEANTAVDGSGDTYLRMCLERLKGNCTLVLVTHRPSLLTLADRAFDIVNGGLAPRSKDGSWPALPPKGGNA